jgi:hypothetical protein
MTGKITQEFLHLRGNGRVKELEGFPGGAVYCRYHIRRRNEALPENKKEQ